MDTDLSDVMINMESIGQIMDALMDCTLDIFTVFVLFIAIWSIVTIAEFELGTSVQSKL